MTKNGVTYKLQTRSFDDDDVPTLKSYNRGNIERPEIDYRNAKKEAKKHYKAKKLSYTSNAENCQKRIDITRRLIEMTKSRLSSGSRVDDLMRIRGVPESLYIKYKSEYDNTEVGSRGITAAGIKLLSQIRRVELVLGTERGRAVQAEQARQKANRNRKSKRTLVSDDKMKSLVAAAAEFFNVEEKSVDDAFIRAYLKKNKQAKTDFQEAFNQLRRPTKEKEKTFDVGTDDRRSKAQIAKDLKEEKRLGDLLEPNERVVNDRVVKLVAPLPPVVAQEKNAEVVKKAKSNVQNQLALCRDLFSACDSASGSISRALGVAWFAFVIFFEIQSFMALCGFISMLFPESIFGIVLNVICEEFFKEMFFDRYVFMFIEVFVKLSAHNALGTLNAVNFFASSLSLGMHYGVAKIPVKYAILIHSLWNIFCFKILPPMLGTTTAGSMMDTVRRMIVREMDFTHKSHDELSTSVYEMIRNSIHGEGVRKTLDTRVFGDLLYAEDQTQPSVYSKVFYTDEQGVLCKTVDARFGGQTFCFYFFGFEFTTNRDVRPEATRKQSPNCPTDPKIPAVCVVRTNDDFNPKEEVYPFMYDHECIRTLSTLVFDNAPYHKQLELAFQKLRRTNHNVDLVSDGKPNCLFSIFVTGNVTCRIGVTSMAKASTTTELQSILQTTLYESVLRNVAVLIMSELSLCSRKVLQFFERVCIQPCIAWTRETFEHNSLEHNIDSAVNWIYQTMPSSLTFSNIRGRSYVLYHEWTLYVLLKIGYVATVVQKHTTTSCCVITGILSLLASQTSDVVRLSNTKLTKVANMLDSSILTPMLSSAYSVLCSSQLMEFLSPWTTSLNILRTESAELSSTRSLATAESERLITPQWSATIVLSSPGSSSFGSTMSYVTAILMRESASSSSMRFLDPITSAVIYWIVLFAKLLCLGPLGLLQAMAYLTFASLLTWYYVLTILKRVLEISRDDLVVASFVVL